MTTSLQGVQARATPKEAGEGAVDAQADALQPHTIAGGYRQRAGSTGSQRSLQGLRQLQHTGPKFIATKRLLHASHCRGQVNHAQWMLMAHSMTFFWPDAGYFSHNKGRPPFLVDARANEVSCDTLQTSTVDAGIHSQSLASGIAQGVISSAHTPSFFCRKPWHWMGNQGS